MLNLDQVLFFLGYFSLLFLLLTLGDVEIVVVWLGLIASFFFLFREKLTLNFYQPGFLAATLLLSVTVFSLLTTVSLPATVLRILVFLGAFLAFLFFLRLDKKWISDELLALGFVAVGVAISLLTLILLIFPQISSRLPPMNLLVSTYGHNHAATYLGFSLPLAFYFWWERRSRWVSIAPLLIIILGLALTFARWSILVSLILFFILLSRVPTSRKQKLLSFVITLPILVSIFILSFFSLGKTECPFLSYQSQLCKSIQVEARPEYWQQAIQGLKEKPLFGWGPGAYFINSRKNAEGAAFYSAYAHNEYLQILAEYGLLGGGIFLIFLAFLFRRALGIIFQKYSLHTALATSVLFLLLDGLLDYNWTFSGILCILFSTAGLIFRESVSKPLVTSPAVKKLYKLVYLSITTTIILLSLLASVSLLLGKLKKPEIANQFFPFFEFQTERLLSSENFPQSQSQLIATLYWNHSTILSKLSQSGYEQEHKAQLLTQMIALEPKNLLYQKERRKLLIEAKDWQGLIQQARDFRVVYPGTTIWNLSEASHLQIVDELVKAGNKALADDPEAAAALYLAAYDLNPWLINATDFEVNMFQQLNSLEDAKALAFLGSFQVQDIGRYHPVIGDWCRGKIKEKIIGSQWHEVSEYTQCVLRFSPWSGHLVWLDASQVFMAHPQFKVGKPAEQRSFVQSWAEVHTILSSHKGEYELDKKSEEELALYLNEVDKL